MNLSIVIITLNEEANLSRCLSSLPKGAELIVVDSFSLDNTIYIANQFGARVFQEKFSDYATQKNIGIAQASNDWIFSIDADEEFSQSLRESISDFISNPMQSFDAFKISRKLDFMGKLLRFGRTQDEPIRLFRSKKLYFHGKVHEKLKVDLNKTSKLREGFLIHYSYKDLDDYFVRFNKYTRLIAKDKLDRNVKVNFLMHVLRPWGEFIDRYFFRLGFLDGYPGYVYALNSCFYSFIKYSKIFEARFRNFKL